MFLQLYLEKLFHLCHYECCLGTAPNASKTAMQHNLLKRAHVRSKVFTPREIWTLQGLGRIGSSCTACQTFAILWACKQWRVPRIHTVGRAKKWLLKQGAMEGLIIRLHCCIGRNGSTKEISRGLRRIQHGGKVIISNAQVALRVGIEIPFQGTKITKRGTTLNSTIIDLPARPCANLKNSFCTTLVLVLQRPHHRAHGKQQSGNVAVQGSGFGGLDTGHL